MAEDSNINQERISLEGQVETIEAALKELTVSFNSSLQSLQATLLVALPTPVHAPPSSGTVISTGNAHVLPSVNMPTDHVSSIHHAPGKAPISFIPPPPPMFENPQGSPLYQVITSNTSLYHNPPPSPPLSEFSQGLPTTQIPNTVTPVVLALTTLSAPVTVNPQFMEAQSSKNKAVPMVDLTKFGAETDDVQVFKTKLQLLEETVKALQNPQGYCAIDLSALCYYPSLQLPYKFKLPDFDKYDGTGCPVAHLSMYKRKMAPYSHDEKLMIHFFHDSLTSPTSVWLSNLDKTKAKTWDDVSRSFLKHYEYNVVLALTRDDLLKTQKRANESFKEFAQKRHSLAAQVHPPLNEQKLSRLFIKSTTGTFRYRLSLCAGYTFAQLVVAGEQIEEGIKSGIIPDLQALQRFYEQSVNGNGSTSSFKKFTQKGNGKKEGETNMISPVYGAQAYGSMPHGQYGNSFESRRYGYPNQQRSPPNATFQYGGIGPKQARKHRHFDKLPIPYAELYTQLREVGLVEPVCMWPVQPPYPEWYNPAARCEYHSGGVGHTIEGCWAFKHRVQDMIDIKELDIEKEKPAPNNTNNPLPDHKAPAT